MSEPIQSPATPAAKPAKNWKRQLWWRIPLACLIAVLGVMWIWSSTQDRIVAAGAKPIIQNPYSADSEQLKIIAEQLGVLQARQNRTEVILAVLTEDKLAEETQATANNTDNGLPACDSPKIRQFHYNDITAMFSGDKEVTLGALRTVSVADGKNTCEAILNTKVGRVKLDYVIRWQNKERSRYEVTQTDWQLLDHGVPDR